MEGGFDLWAAQQPGTECTRGVVTKFVKQQERRSNVSTRQKFLGITLNVSVVRHKRLESSYYDPDNRVIYISDHFISKVARAAVGRSDKWLVGHELGHAFLDIHNKTVKSDLQKVFGNLSEKAYSASALDEVSNIAQGHGDMITPRAMLCPEEGFADCCAYLYCGDRTRISEET